MLLKLSKFNKTGPSLVQLVYAYIHRTSKHCKVKRSLQEFIEVAHIKTWCGHREKGFVQFNSKCAVL